MKSIALVVLVCVVASACGAAHRLTRNEYAREMRALHTRALRRAVREWPTLVCRRVVGRREWIAEVRRARVFAPGWTRRVEALRPPTDLVAAHERYVAFLKDDQRYLGRLSDHVARGTLTPAQANDRLTNPPPRLARELFGAVRGFARAQIDVFNLTPSGWSGGPPRPAGCQAR